MSTVRQRLAIVAGGLPTAALLAGAAATQFAAWRLNYHPALGAPVFEHIYWPWRILQWRAAPWAAQASSVFDTINLGLMGVVGLGCMVAAGAATRTKRPRAQEGVHGTARFLTEPEIRQLGLLPAKEGGQLEGVYVGGFVNRRGTLEYLRHSGPEHVLGIGPLRSGKTIGLAEPTLLTEPDSMVIYDTKGELWARSAGWRTYEADNIVMRWAPADLTNTVAWNPLDAVRWDTPHEFGDIGNIIEALADPKGEGMSDHWAPTAANMLVGIALHVCHQARTAGLTAGISDVLHALDDPQRDVVTLFRDMTAAQHRQVAEIGQAMLSTEARERSGIISTGRRILRLFRDPVVARNTARSSFRIDDLMNHDKPASLYIETRGEDELRLRPLVRLFLNLMMGRLISAPMRMVGGQEASPHKRRLTLLIDEFASLGAMETFELGLSKCSGYGIKAYLLVQDREQILEAYGSHETITSHCRIKAAYAPTNIKTAEWLSECCGDTTVTMEEFTESSGPGGRTRNRSFHAHRRRLMDAAEVMKMRSAQKDAHGHITDPGDVLVIVAGADPIRGTQSLSFRDPEFNERRSLPAPQTMVVR